MPNALPFQYLMRGQQMQYLDGDLLAHAIDQRDRDLEDYLGQQTSWVPLPFSSPWVDYDLTGAWQRCGYRKVGDMVHLRGLAKNGTANTTIGVLPVGFRPPAAVLWATVASNNTVDAPYRLDVDAGGSVIVRGAAATLAYVSLLGSFSVTP